MDYATSVFDVLVWLDFVIYRGEVEGTGLMILDMFKLPEMTWIACSWRTISTACSRVTLVYAGSWSMLWKMAGLLVNLEDGISP